MTSPSSPRSSREVRSILHPGSSREVQSILHPGSRHYPRPVKRAAYFTGVVTSYKALALSALLPRPVKCAAYFTGVALLALAPHLQAQSLSGTNNTNNSLILNSVVVGGSTNIIDSNATNSVLVGGHANLITNLSSYSVLIGGRSNVVTGLYSAVASGFRNSAAGNFSAVLSGNRNTNNGRFSLIGGGYSNNATGDYATIMGGYANVVSGAESAIVTGRFNLVLGINSSVVSGRDNKVTNSFVTNSTNASIITTNSPDFSTISGGRLNSISNAYSFIGGGRANIGQGLFSMIVGGSNNLAGDYALASGTRAKATNQGSFVWSDFTPGSDFASTTNNQFLIRASGGVGINTNITGTNALAVRGAAFIDGNLNVTGTINGTFSNATFTTLSVAGPITSSSNSISLQPGGTTGFTVEPQASATLALPNPDEPTTYTGTAHNVVAGFSNNFVPGGIIGATIAGGGQLVVSNLSGVEVNANEVLNHFGTVSGGAANTADGLMATVSGGSGNWAIGHWATIGGGLDNLIEDTPNIPPYALYISTIGGGYENSILNAPGGTIGGGALNLISNGGVFTNVDDFIPSLSTISGGRENTAENASYGVIAGGAQNYAGTEDTNGVSYPTIGGGYENVVRGNFATVPGGWGNEANGFGSFAAGLSAQANHDGVFIWADQQFVSTEVTNEQGETEIVSLAAPFESTAPNQFLIRASGGVGINTNNPGTRALLVNGDLEVTGDIIGNLSVSNATFTSLTVNGPIYSGIGNTLTGPNAVIGGGSINTASGPNAAIGGGSVNTASGDSAVAGGGYANTASGMSSTVAGGEVNLASNVGASVSGGYENTSSGRVATIAGGEKNVAAGLAAAIGGGYYNYASGDYSVVSGGINNLAGLDTNSTNISANYSTVGGGDQNEATADHATIPGGLNNKASGVGSFAAGVNAKATNNYSFVWGGDPTVDTGSFGTGTYTARAPQGARFISGTTNGVDAGVTLFANTTDWAVLSDSNAKTAVTPIDHRETLRKVAALPVTAWNYKHDPNRRYIGPMAQDFHAAFGLGSDDKHISTLDTDGVTLSAIKGLVEEIKEQDAALAEREEQIEALERAVRELRAGIPSGNF
jgi:hypothetical protein